VLYDGDRVMGGAPIAHAIERAIAPQAAFEAAAR
jgi:hypothetical protein